MRVLPDSGGAEAEGVEWKRKLAEQRASSMRPLQSHHMCWEDRMEEALLLQQLRAEMQDGMPPVQTAPWSFLLSSFLLQSG